MARRIYLIFVTLLLVAVMVIPCSASMNPFSFCNDNVEVSLPEGWGASAYRYTDDEMGYYGLFAAENEDCSININAFLIKTDEDTNWDTASKDEALEMYDKAGERIASYFLFYYEDYDPDINLKDVKYIKSADDYGTGYVRAKYDNLTYIYITSGEDGSFYLFEVWLDDDNLKSDLKEVNDIVRSFSDYGYEPEEDSEFMDIGSIIAIAFAVITVLIGKASAVKAKNGTRKKKVTVDTLAGPVKMNIPKAISKPVVNLRHKDVEKSTRTVDGNTTTTVHCTYEDSLYTLYKSGLLTRKELNEMLEKHQNRRR